MVSHKGIIEFAEWKPTSNGSIRFGKATRFTEWTGEYSYYCDNMFYSHGGWRVMFERVLKENAFFYESGAYRDENCSL